MRCATISFIVLIWQQCTRLIRVESSVHLLYLRLYKSVTKQGLHNRIVQKTILQELFVRRDEYSFANGVFRCSIAPRGRSAFIFPCGSPEPNSSASCYRFHLWLALFTAHRAANPSARHQETGPPGANTKHITPNTLVVKFSFSMLTLKCTR